MQVLILTYGVANSIFLYLSLL